MADEPKEGGGMAGAAPGNNAPKKRAEAEKRTAAREKPAAQQAQDRAREPD